MLLLSSPFIPGLGQSLSEVVSPHGELGFALTLLWGAPKGVRKALWPSGSLGVCWQGAMPPVRDVFSPGIGLTCSQHPASFGLLPPPSAPDQSKLPRAYGGTAAEIL